MKIVWAVNFVLMAWCQFWAYSTFWIANEEVYELDGVRHLVEGVAKIECTEKRSRRSSYIYGEFRVWLKKGEYYTFGGIGIIESCKEFYSGPFYDKHYLKRLSPLTGQGREITQVGPDTYEEIKLDGYFKNRHAYQVSFDGHEWLSYKSTKTGQRDGLLMFSLLSLYILLATWFRSKTRITEKRESRVMNKEVSSFIIELRMHCDKSFYQY